MTCFYMKCNTGLKRVILMLCNNTLKLTKDHLIKMASQLMVKTTLIREFWQAPRPESFEGHACNFTKSNTPPLSVFRFLNCTNVTKSFNISQIIRSFIIVEYYYGRLKTKMFVSSNILTFFPRSLQHKST